MATSGDDDHSSRKLKFLCSFGGSIAPRPSDGALRYFGGDTRLIAVRDNASFSDFTAKMAETFGGAVVIKYQLPDGDLDALVTVSCPEDFENMMEEYYRFASDGSSKLRVFLFSPAESSSTVPVSIPESGPVSGSGSGYLGVSPPRTVGVPVTTVGGGLGVGSVPVANAGPVAVYPHFDSHSQGFSHVAYVQNPELMQYASGTQLGVGTAPVGLVAVAPNQPVYVTEFGVSAAPHSVGVVGSVQTMDDPKFQNLPHPTQLIYNSERHSGGIGAYVGHGDVSSSHQYSMRSDEPSMWQTNLPHAHSDTVVHGVNSGVPKTTPEFHSLLNGSVMIGQDPHKIVATTSGNYVMTTPMTSLAYSQVDQANDVDSVVFPGHGRSEGRSSAGAEGSPRNSQSYHEMSPNQQGHYQENHTPLIAPKQQSLVPDLLTSSPHIADGTSARDGMFQTFEPISQSNKNEFSNYDNKEKLSEGMMQNLNLNHHGTSGLNEQWSKNPQISISTNNSGASPRNLPNPLEQSASTTAQTSTLHNIPSGESSQPSFFGNFGADPHFGASGPPMPERLLGTHPNNFKLPDGNRKIQVSQDKSGSNIGSAYSRPVGNMPLSNLQGSQPNTNVVAQNSTVSDSLFSDKDPWSIIQNSQMPVKSQEVANTESLFPGDAVNENALKSNPDVDILLGEDSYLKRNSDPQSVPSPKVSADEHLKQELKATAEGVAASVLPSSHNSFETNELTKELRKSKETYSSDAGLQKHMLSEGNKSEGIMAKLGDLSLGFKIPEDIGRLQIIKNSDLEEIRELGSGTFGTVYYGMWRGSDVAIKRINDRCFSGKPSEQERMRADFWNEACKLADLHHPNVVAFYGIVLDGPGGSIATVTEFMANGSLRNALQKNDKILDPRKRLLLAMDVAFGMEYLHGKKIVHFDLKSDNLLVNLRDSQRPICKVGDLGLSKVKRNTLISGGVQGTLPWMAPELLNGSSNLVSEKVDVFSFGIVMWELLTGKEPYEDLHYGAIIGGIVNDTLRPPIPEFGEPAWKSLMERCWTTDPSKRPSFIEIVEQLRAMAASNSHKGQVPAQTTTGGSSHHAS